MRKMTATALRAAARVMSEAADGLSGRILETDPRSTLFRALAELETALNGPDRFFGVADAYAAGEARRFVETARNIRNERDQHEPYSIKWNASDQQFRKYVMLIADDVRVLQLGR